MAGISGGQAAPALPSFRLEFDALFPVARQLREASSHARRAQMLLRLPDALVLEKFDDLVEAARESGFAPGLTYLQLRFAALHAVRRPDGSLPEGPTRALAIWSNGLHAMGEA